MKIKNISLIVVFICLALMLTGCYHDVATRTDFVMDTVATITIYGTKKQEPLDNAFNAVKTCDSQWNAFDPESEISKINANAGKVPTTVSDDTYNLIKSSLHDCETTDGALDITIGPLVNLWQIEEPETKEPPNAKSVQEAKDLVDYHNVQLNDKARSVFLTKPGMAINLGSVAKGAAADLVRTDLEKENMTRGVVNLGGNVVLIGKKNFAESFRVQVEDPFEPDKKALGILSLEDKSVVTSGDYRRYFTDLSGKRYHHILDPKTGYPAENDLCQVTIIGDQSMECDALSTALFVMGSEKAVEYAKSNGISVIMVTKDRDVFISKELEKYFDSRPARMNDYHFKMF